MAETPQTQLNRITDAYLEMARQCEPADPEKAKTIREHVAAVRLHYAEMDALLIRCFGRSLEDKDIPVES